MFSFAAEYASTAEPDQDSKATVTNPVHSRLGKYLKMTYSSFFFPVMERRRSYRPPRNQLHYCRINLRNKRLNSQAPTLMVTLFIKRLRGF